MSLIDSASLIVTPNGYKEGKLYSVIPSNGSGDMSVVRATTATRVNSSGLVELVPYNLVQYSEQFDNAWWLKFQANVTADNTTAPNGTTTADKVIASTNGAAVVYRSETYLVSGVYNFSIYAKSGNQDKVYLEAYGVGGTACSTNINLTTQTIISQTNFTNINIENVGNGWFRISATFSNLGGSIVTFGFGMATSVSTNDFAYFWGGQLVEGSTAKDYLKTETRLNIPRLDYSNGTCPSLLVEPQRTNTILNSVLSGTTSLPTSWNFSISTGTSAPTPSIYSQTGQAYSFTTAATRQAIFQNQSYTSGSTYSFSVYVESVTGSIRVDNVIFQTVAGTQTFYKDGVLINASDFIESGHRYTTLMVASSTTTAQVRIGNGAGGATTGTVVLSMPQLEVGSYSTSYIPTTSASVTRNADVISKTGISSLIGQTEGTLFYDGYYGKNADEVYLFLQGAASSGTNNSIYLQKHTSGRIKLIIVSGTTNIVFINGGSFSVGDRVKIVCAYKANDFVLYINGVQIGTNTSGTPPACANLQLASYAGAPTSENFIAEGGTNAVALWQTRLTNDQLAQLTTI